MISSSVPVTSTLSLTTLRSPIRSSVLSSLNQLKTNRLRSSKHSRRNLLFNKLWRRRSRRLSLPRERRNRESIISDELSYPFSSATLIGEALKKNPAYLKLQRIEYGKKVSRVIAQSPNKVINLQSDLAINRICRL